MVPTWFLGDDDGTEPTIENDYAWSGPWLAADAVRQLSTPGRLGMGHPSGSY